MGVCHSYGLCVKDSVISVYRRLAHPRGVVIQVACSPGSHLLLTRLSRSINVWTQHGILQKTISRPTIVESIVWLPGTGEGGSRIQDYYLHSRRQFFKPLSVEGSNVVKLSSNGKILGIYKFENMNLQGIAVTPDGTRVLGFITLTRIKLKRKLNLQEKHGSQLDEDKATPQLWKLDASKNTSRLTIHQRYFPKVPTDFAGPSYFGGKNEELVLCVDKNRVILFFVGDLHIWDRESGTLLHRIRAYELGRDVTCIAWNHPHDPFMFATGSLHGSVQLWTRHEQQLLSPTLRSASPDDMRDSDIPLPQQEQEAGSGQRNDALR
ncbi:hypothetical protein F5877DRAFT_78408 [Lentinula edodes]|nr:hypothetical protein F5877DRAFT_78408 [Lentinula edodes]